MAVYLNGDRAGRRCGPKAHQGLVLLPRNVAHLHTWLLLWGGWEMLGVVPSAFTELLWQVRMCG